MSFLGFFFQLVIFLTPISTAQTAGFTLSQVQDKLTTFRDFLTSDNITAAGNLTFEPLSGCNLACYFVDYSSSYLVSWPKSSLFESELSQYWSEQQEKTISTCRFTPKSANDVSFVVVALRLTKCKFAVKSGGHATFSGASNIKDGVTIDLAILNIMEVSINQTEVSIGSGNRWGGRVSGIGVGGLILSGGLSFLSQQHGLACDNVNNYQVVLADGTIIDVNYQSYSDLYFALRGGGNNFGIVTRFDLATFPQGDLWGGQYLHFLTPAIESSLNAALHWININGPVDKSAATILAYVYVATLDLYYSAVEIEYAQPIAEPAILQNFTDIAKAHLPLGNTMRFTNVTDLTLEFNSVNPSGFRQTMWAMMIKNSASLMNEINVIWKEELQVIKAVPDVLPSLVYQPITSAVSANFRRNGGNALGISSSDGPLTLINVNFAWSGENNDDIILATARRIIRRANSTAYSQGLGHRFIYQNYASEEQKPLQSYGPANYKKLREISKKYDPDEVWQKLQPGYFKLF